MPRYARRKIIDESRVGTYLCSTRCVRRSSFRDRTTGGLELSHRQEWILQRLRVLALLFAIEVIDFVIVDNEFYVILRNRPDLAKELSAEQVIRRWNRMSRRSLDLLPEMDSKRVKKERAKRGLVAKLRKRLSSISWLMIMLKEPIARAANAEDEVRGHFFGERFSSDELKDGEQCLATSLQINSLPVRLGLAEDLASSRFTAAFARQNGAGDWLAHAVEADVAEGAVVETDVAEGDAAGAILAAELRVVSVRRSRHARRERGARARDEERHRVGAHGAAHLQHPTRVQRQERQGSAAARTAPPPPRARLGGRARLRRVAERRVQPLGAHRQPGAG